MRMTKTVSMMAAIFLILMSTAVVVSATTYDGNESDLYCYKKTRDVTIDGNISTGEWTDADSISWYYTPTTDHKDANIYCYAKWDDTYIYFMVDLCPDNSTEDLDYCMIYLDEDNDGKWGYGAAYEHLFEVLGSQVINTYAKNASGWSYADDDCSAYFGYSTSSKASWNHRIIEFRINLTAINRSTTMGILFSGYGTLAPNYFSTDGANASNHYENDTVANWTDLHMSNSQYLAGYIQQTLIPMVITLMGVVITVSILMVFVKSFTKMASKT